MKIVHYIPEIKKHDIISDELLSVVNVMRDMADVKLVVGKEAGKSIYKDGKPDILHVHTCWDYHTTRLLLSARHKGIATIVSPHGGFSPYTLQNEEPIEKRAKMLTYQNDGIKDADAVVLSTQEEMDSIAGMKLQKNTALVH